MKKMIKIAFVAAFAAIAGYGVYANQKSEVLSDLTLANVEALAGSGETTIECCLLRRRAAAGASFPIKSTTSLIISFLGFRS